ncbi:hypothetical protein OG576_30765 [Streptomyces sp. NBC_01500]|nr:hypothetical protein [Streptomyces sp. NBC_01500]MCX4553160.1 hypothetical protein [Streptomyces sp. NBC_01500]
MAVTLVGLLAGVAPLVEEVDQSVGAAIRERLLGVVLDAGTAVVGELGHGDAVVGVGGLVLAGGAEIEDLGVSAVERSVRSGTHGLVRAV